MSKKLFYIFHICVVIFTVWLVALEYFTVDIGVLKEYTKESGIYELGSGFLLFTFGAYLLIMMRSFNAKNIKYTLLLIGFVLILGALEELSWGQHLLGYESIGFFSEHNNQHEMNLHNFIPNWFFGLMVNLSFYIFFVFIPILIYLYRDKILSSHYAKYAYILEYFPSVELVLVFLFAFSLQKYFIVDTYTDTIALFIAFILMGIIVRKKEEFLFSLHYLLIICVTLFFLFAHEVFSYKNLQYEIREFVLIYAMTYWLFKVLKLLKEKNKVF